LLFCLNRGLRQVVMALMKWAIRTCYKFLNKGKQWK